MKNQFALTLFHVQMSDTASRVISRFVKGLIVAITLLSITPQAQGATTTVREIIKDPAIFYRARTMPYYLCEDPSDCVARYDARWESTNLNRDIEIFNPQPNMDRTVNGKTISITYGAKITTELGTTIIPHRALDLNIIVRCPLKENGTPWQYRAITRAPHSTGVCVLRIPSTQQSCSSSKGLGNPIYPEAQLKLQREEDYISQSGLLDFVRTFRSDTGDFGSQLDMRRIDVTGFESNSHCDSLTYDFPSSGGGRDIFYYCFKDASWGGTEYLQLVDSTGNYTFFDASLDPDNPTSNPSITTKPQRVTDINGNTSWQVVQGNHIERYNAQGELLDKRFADGRFVTYTYSNEETPTSIAPRPGLKIAAQDPWGRETEFNYNADGKLSLFTDPSGELIQYR